LSLIPPSIFEFPISHRETRIRGVNSPAGGKAFHCFALPGLPDALLETPGRLIYLAFFLSTSGSSTRDTFSL